MQERTGRWREDMTCAPKRLTALSREHEIPKTSPCGIISCCLCEMCGPPALATTSSLKANLSTRLQPEHDFRPKPKVKVDPDRATACRRVFPVQTLDRATRIFLQYFSKQIADKSLLSRTWRDDHCEATPPPDSAALPSARRILNPERSRLREMLPSPWEAPGLKPEKQRCWLAKPETPEGAVGWEAAGQALYKFDEDIDVFGGKP